MKRLLAATLALCLLCPLTAFSAAAKASRPVGDLNNDGIHTVLDYILLKRHILETYTLSDEALPYADLDGDGQIDAADYMLLKRVILGTAELPDHTKRPSEDEALQLAVGFYVLLKNGSGQELVKLEGEFGAAYTELNQLILRYLTSLEVKDETIWQLENEWSITLLSAEERQALLEKLTETFSGWLQGLLDGLRKG